MKNRSDGEEIEAGEEERKKLGEGAVATSLHSAAPSLFFFFCKCFSFYLKGKINYYYYYYY